MCRHWVPSRGITKSDGQIEKKGERESQGNFCCLDALMMMKTIMMMMILIKRDILNKIPISSFTVKSKHGGFYKGDLDALYFIDLSYVSTEKYANYAN